VLQPVFPLLAVARILEKGEQQILDRLCHFVPCALLAATEFFVTFLESSQPHYFATTLVADRPSVFRSQALLIAFLHYFHTNSAKHLDGKKEIVAWFDPAGVIGRQPTGRHHAMYMRVKFEFLSPAVQHAEEADFRTEMLGIARDFQKGFRTGAKQEIVDDLLVLQDQRSQMTRKREDNVDVARREKFLATRCEPAIASSCLTLRAVPISARNGELSITCIMGSFF
jgi:hypothetical protein